VGGVTAPEDLAWAAIMLARDPDTCASILAGRRVRAGSLDWFFLRRGLRGDPLPPAESYIQVSIEMLEAIVEGGPLAETWPDVPAHLHVRTGGAPTKKGGGRR
jgi:hypothetical protein